MKNQSASAFPDHLGYESDLTMQTGSTSTDAGSESSGAAGNQSISLAVLYWLESRYVSWALNSYKRQSRTSEDAWWISEGSDVHGPVCFAEVVKTVLSGSACRGLVHHSRVGEEPTPWQVIAYQPWWSNRLIARFWTVSFWLFWALLGWVLLDLATPRLPHTVRDIAYWLLLLLVTLKRRALRAHFVASRGSWKSLVIPRFKLRMR